MTLTSFLILLLIAGICGAIAQAVVGYTRGGCFASVGLGLIGALLGSWIARQAGLPDLYVIRVGGADVPLVWTIIGASLVVLLVALAKRPRS